MAPTPPRSGASSVCFPPCRRAGSPSTRFPPSSGRTSRRRATPSSRSPGYSGPANRRGRRARAPGSPPRQFAPRAGILRTASQAMPTGARAEFDPTLVRGMGYYTGTIFEATSPAYPSSIAGGGRYDRMIGRLLNRDVPACGFSIGFERLIGILSERAQAPGAPATAGAGARRVAFLVDEHGDLTPALAASRALRTGGDLVS